MFCGIKSYNTCSNDVCQHWHSCTIKVLPLVYCPVDDTLFEVGPEIRCSGVSSRYCCYGNHTAGSKPIWKLFVAVSGELNSVCDLSVPKIISECCELMKSYHINCGGPVFWDTLWLFDPQCPPRGPRTDFLKPMRGLYAMMLSICSLKRVYTKTKKN